MFSSNCIFALDALHKSICRILYGVECVGAVWLLKVFAVSHVRDKGERGPKVRWIDRMDCLAISLWHTLSSETLPFQVALCLFSCSPFKRKKGKTYDLAKWLMKQQFFPITG